MAGLAEHIEIDRNRFRSTRRPFRLCPTLLVRLMVIENVLEGTGSRWGSTPRAQAGSLAGGSPWRLAETGPAAAMETRETRTS